MYKSLSVDAMDDSFYRMVTVSSLNDYEDNETFPLMAKSIETVLPGNTINGIMLETVKISNMKKRELLAEFANHFNYEMYQFYFTRNGRITGIDFNIVDIESKIVKQGINDIFLMKILLDIWYPRKARECHFQDNCKRINCWYNHSDSWYPGLKPDIVLP